MKRIKAACLYQTVLFTQKEDLDSAAAAAQVRREVEHYKQALDRHHTRHKILAETVQPDGSILVELQKEYNSYSVGHYLD